MKEYYIAISGTKGYYSGAYKAVSPEEATDKALAEYGKLAGKIKSIKVREIK